MTDQDRPRPSGSDEPAPAAEPPLRDAESTESLLARMRRGDALATDALFRRSLPILRRWARGRLPHEARDLADTEDLVQDTLLNALRRIDAFDCRGEGALQAYLRQALANRIRDEIRRAHRRPIHGELSTEAPDQGVTPLEHAIGRQNVERYESALHRLRPGDREAVIGRLELQLTYEELAGALARPSANAARVAVIRAVRRLIEEMAHET
jgi:RNA polymerase sigma-70 factor (ECF subfamily)